MLSLTPKAKAKLADLTNKSVLYGFVLNDDDVRLCVMFRCLGCLLTISGQMGCQDEEGDRGISSGRYRW